MRPLFGLAPGEACRSKRVAAPAGRLLPHRFTLACVRALSGRAHRRFAFCCAVCEIALPGSYPAPLSLVSGLSSSARSIKRADAAV